MGYRHIIIKKAIKLNLHNNNLQILKRNEEEVHIPLEDISIIMVEDPYATITSRLLTECSKFGISMIFCDETFLPNTQTIPLNVHYNQLGVVNKQIKLHSSIKGLLWQQIIRAKMMNQYRVVELTSNDERAKQLLLDYVSSVSFNDEENKEGIAAKVFFTALYGDDFIRFDESPISMALNYGYSILNNAMIRQLVALGMNTNFGVWHDSEKNPYNLASDFIEPFRPIVDYYVYWNKDKIEDELSTDVRKDLVSLLTNEVIISGKKCSVDYAMELLVKSYLNQLNCPDCVNLALPEMKECLFYGQL